MDVLEFSKGHGTGNDFVIIPDPEAELVLTPQLVTALCDRRFGIGADGVLRVVRTAAAARQPGFGVEPDLLGSAEWFMDYRNADGSLAEMCGNGVRVFARYLVATDLVATRELTLGTRAGAVVAEVAAEAVSVTMRLPRVYGSSSARVGGVELSGVAVDCGNPHLVCPVPPDLALAGLDLSQPPAVDTDLFPDGVNVEFTTPVGDHQVRMRVFERGVGETLSCGSGACAVAAVALWGRPPAGVAERSPRSGGRNPAEPAGRTSGVETVDLPGGRLVVSLTSEGCVLTGPAVLVAHGTVDVPSLG